MPRTLYSQVVSDITSGALKLCFLVDIGLVSGTEHIWSGIGDLVWMGNTYKGVGQLGGVGEITEVSEPKATGTTIALSGIDPTLMTESLNDIKQGAPATVWLGVYRPGISDGFDSANKLFVGTVDKPINNLGPDSNTITLALETRMALLQRATNRRYTNADQRYYHSDDIGFAWVETQNDIALIWG